VAVKLHGVMISDVVGSSRTQDLRTVLSAKLRNATMAHLEEKRIRLPYAVTAGDEFQTIVNGLDRIPGLLFDLRRRMRPLQLRIGVGVGAVPGRLRPPVNELSGEAFEFARIAIDQAKTDRSHSRTTRFHSRNEEFDVVANLVYDLYNALVGSPSEKQWETVDAYLAKGRVDLAAKSLKINPSTASRNLRRSYWWQSLETIEGMEKIIRSCFGLHESVSKQEIA
jgi:SatD family (SatD)